MYDTAFDLIINTAAHTMGATIAGAQFEILFGERWVVLFSVLFTYLMLQFTEILPKTLGVIRPVHFCSPEGSAAELLKVFVEQHEHMAIVGSSEGKTLGLVTLEDLVEELVGELGDEFDRLPRMCHRLSGDMWMVGGGLPVTELSQRLDLSLPDAQGSTSAWLIRRLDRVPRANELYRTDRAEFMVRRTRRGKVFEVAITRVPCCVVDSRAVFTGATNAKEE